MHSVAGMGVIYATGVYLPFLLLILCCPPVDSMLLVRILPCSSKPCNFCFYCCSFQVSSDDGHCLGVYWLIVQR